jgi:hypothetical protein
MEHLSPKSEFEILQTSEIPWTNKRKVEVIDFLNQRSGVIQKCTSENCAFASNKESFERLERLVEIFCGGRFEYRSFQRSFISFLSPYKRDYRDQLFVVLSSESIRVALSLSLLALKAKYGLIEIDLIKTNTNLYNLLQIPELLDWDEFNMCRIYIIHQYYTNTEEGKTKLMLPFNENVDLKNYLVKEVPKFSPTVKKYHNYLFATTLKERAANSKKNQIEGGKTKNKDTEEETQQKTLVILELYQKALSTREPGDYQEAFDQDKSIKINDKEILKEIKQIRDQLQKRYGLIIGTYSKVKKTQS